ncbi:MAG: glycosyltransferase family 4 protein, partial [Spirochaetes bacterium]|nr:glycosyltransferase family 4 protein [Spirochaetota bacterium]
NYTSYSPLVRKRSIFLKPLSIFIEKKIFNSATVIIAVSSFLKQQMIEKYRINEQKIIMLPNASDPNFFSPAMSVEKIQIEKLANGPIVGFVGGFYTWHGLDLLIKAFVRVLQNDSNSILVLIGDGPEKKRIENMVEELQIRDNVFFAGKVSYHSLPAWISLFRVGVMPDSNNYGSPMKIFEYMAMGKPVVVPDYGPLRDAVEHGKEGFIFPKGNVEIMTSYINLLISNEELYNKMSRSARMIIVEKYNWDNIVNIILNYLQTSA